ncbi:sugar phosphate nucleotidyltransferase [Maritimibacter fusiformis]|uniref:Mannose-1-phosphate guanylyltransferase n=1 Tax=Maritimibacter fusiformis TaxID=2603819 RepID=A0A5D0RQX5_9RHOB|nr:sugar phosphate nucleotidyltransferase [Maritimibacter fusiformis]TYB83285.1 hypothetical protein FVF75_03660 [Maritimibacter fusiformis]
MKITPVILCGGSGTRLWPLSRQSCPKQFLPLMGELTLFQASAFACQARQAGWNSRHRMEHPGKTLIEVQTGRYLGEDEIVRHEDVYARIP